MIGLVALLVCLSIAPAAAVTLTVSSLADNTNNGTLRAAIIAANAFPGSTITFQSGLSGTIDLNSSLPTITSSTTLQGPGSSAIAIDGQSLYRPFYINAAASTVGISGLVIQHGSDQADHVGGAGMLVAAGSVILSNLVFSTNATAYNGGGLDVQSGTVSLTNCTFAENTSVGSGGGAIQNDGILTLTSCSIYANIAHGNGGGGIFSNGNLTLTSCSISGNSTTSNNGGGINNNNGTVTISNCIISGNTASGLGGGIENLVPNVQATLTITNSTLSGNSAGANGGAISGSSILSGCLLLGNVSNGSGGALYGGAHLTNCTLIGNQARTGNGGAIYNVTSLYNDPIVMTNCTLTGNTAGVHGSGIYVGGTHGGGQFTNCIAYGDIGDEVFVSGSVSSATHCDILGGIPAGTADGGGNINANPLFDAEGPKNNGGLTDTLSLIAGSPCYGAGTFIGSPPLDERGFGRPNPPSIGAFDSTPSTSTLHTFISGLQMISAPTDDTGYALVQVFNQPNTVLAVWNPTTVAYSVSPASPADTLRPGQGYWVRFLSSTNLLNVGAPVDSTVPFSISLGQGWNMIGCPFSSTVTINTLAVIDALNVTHSVASAVSSGLISSVLYTYQPGDTAYEIIPFNTGSLTPYYGYWLYASLPCRLVVPALSGPPPPP